MMTEEIDSDMSTGSAVLSYHISGSVAKKRLVPLLQRRLRPHQLQEIDAATTSVAVAESPAKLAAPPSLVWENTLMKSTRALREAAVVHSHLAHCASILEDKWALALVQDEAQRGASSKSNSANEDSCEIKSLGLLPTHCLRGKAAVVDWCVQRWGSCNDDHDHDYDDDLWVLKDAEANGAGGVWVLSQHRWRKLCGVAAEGLANADLKSPLREGHRYIAQRYLGCRGSRRMANDQGDNAGCGRGLALWYGRKCHIRCYAVVTGDLAVWLQRRAFLHVANKPFVHGTDSHADDEVHITNCCANSADKDAFAGEIVITDFADPATFPGLHADSAPAPPHASVSETSEGNSAQDIATTPVGAANSSGFSLARAFQDVAEALSALVAAAAPCLEAQRSPHHFEYLGVDVMVDASGRAWLLEVNCPPSQDTATGLPAAEALHDGVLGDLLDKFVLPRVLAPEAAAAAVSAGHSHVEALAAADSSPADQPPVHPAAWLAESFRGPDLGWVQARPPSLVPFVPAKRTTGNAIRWNRFEKTALKRRAQENNGAADKAQVPQSSECC